MSLGYPTTKNDIDAKAGGLAVQLRNILNECANLKLWLDAQTDQDMLNRGYVAGEIAQLRSFATDYNKLNGVYLGTATQATAYDFRTFAKFLSGMA
jgi:hypothetical protein